MVRKNATNEEIRREGLAALLERLGPAGTIRFLQQYESGEGDYTKKRHAWLDKLTVDDIIEDIRRRCATQPEHGP